jgi:hypothetical protein
MPRRQQQQPQQNKSKAAAAAALVVKQQQQQEIVLYILAWAVVLAWGSLTSHTLQLVLLVIAVLCSIRVRSLAAPSSSQSKQPHVIKLSSSSSLHGRLLPSALQWP